MKNNNLLWSKYIFLSVILFFCLQSYFYQTGFAEENTESYYYVDISGNGNFTTIQDALTEEEQVMLLK